MIHYLTGDCREVMRTLPAASVHCVVTSPPYWSLRDYGIEPSTWADGWVGCLGLEPTPALFVAHLVEVFAEVWRVLRDDGVCWVNMGDSYANAGVSGMKPKDLVGVPWMMAFALRDFGWYLRQEIIWHKPNPMTEAIKDRCTKAHEQIFLLAKSDRYFFDFIAIQERAASAGKPLGITTYQADGAGRAPSGNQKPENYRKPRSNRRNKRSVWTIPVARYKGAHFATFPTKLVEPCIKSGTSEEGTCPTCGAPFERVYKKKLVKTRSGKKSKLHGVSGLRADNPHEDQRGLLVGNRDPERKIAVYKTVGWRPTCACPQTEARGRCVVLDPFGGSGTVAEVAAKLGCDAILIDRNPDYVKQQKQRNQQGTLL